MAATRRVVSTWGGLCRHTQRPLPTHKQQVGADRLIISHLDVADEGSVKDWAKGLADKVIV